MAINAVLLNAQRMCIFARSNLLRPRRIIEYDLTICMHHHLPYHAGANLLPMQLIPRCFGVARRTDRILNFTVVVLRSRKCCRLGQCNSLPVDSTCSSSHCSHRQQSSRGCSACLLAYSGMWRADADAHMAMGEIQQLASPPPSPACLLACLPADVLAST
jgi:hypothetical protein